MNEKNEDIKKIRQKILPILQDYEVILTSGARHQWVVVGLGMLLCASTAYAGGLTVPSGSKMDVNTGTLNVSGDVTFSGTLEVSTGTISASGNWTNTGTFTSGTGTVIFITGSRNVWHFWRGSTDERWVSSMSAIWAPSNNGTNQTITGSTTFYNFSKVESTNDSTDVTLTFDNTATQTIGGLLTLDGLDDNDRINLVSNLPGTQWSLICNGTFAIDYVDVQDSDASGGTEVDASDATSIDSDNNLNWLFQRVGGPAGGAGYPAIY